MIKHIIWSNTDIDFEEWKNDMMEYVEETYEDDRGDVSEDDVWNFIRNELDFKLECERNNLDQQTDGRIIAIADIGRWNGRVNGYKIIDANAKEILYSSADYILWYGDGYNIRSIQHHHDGTNYIEYRVIREDRNIDNLLDAIYNGEEISRKKLNYYTKSLYPYVAKIYGWK